MLNFCDTHAVTAFDAASLPFSQQVAIFQSMNIISGVHGAGLMNQLWMAEGAAVIDVMSPKYINSVFGGLAHSLGNSYQMIAQTYMEHAGMVCDATKVFVPCDQLEWALINARRIMSQSKPLEMHDTRL